jgi:hypothetical protein
MMVNKYKKVMTMKQTNYRWKKLAKAFVALFFLTSFSFISHDSKAQIAQGTWLLGGEATFQAGEVDQGFFLVPGVLGDNEFSFLATINFFEDDLPTTVAPGAEIQFTNWQVVPEFGYFLSDRWALGIGAGFRDVQIEDIPTDAGLVENSAWFIPINPFVRYYIPLGDDGRGGFWFEIQGNFEFGEFESTGPGIADESPTLFFFQPQANFAFYYFVTPNFAIEGIWSFASYSLLTADIDGDDDVNSYRFDVGADLNDFAVGAKWYFYR